VTVRPLRLLGDPVLRTPCDRVLRFDAALARLVQDLLDTVQVPGRARCLQHETGHLYGELYIDRLTGPERRTVMRQIRQQHPALNR
jgi:peptide deformylase